MRDSTDVTELRKQAKQALDSLSGFPAADINQLVKKLRNHREYGLMGRLSEAMSRRDPNDATNRKLYAQYLMETGNVTAAIDVLEALAGRLPRNHPEHVEAVGLLGRCHKQIFFDAGDRSTEGAQSSLKRAIAFYRSPFETDPAANTWHGINLVALLARSQRMGLRPAPELDFRAIAQRIISELETPSPTGRLRDEWSLPTLAEAYLALGQWDDVERTLRTYATGSGENDSFMLASTLRQFRHVWGLEDADAPERGRTLVSILHARLLQLSGASMDVGPQELQLLRKEPEPVPAQLEAVLGEEGPRTYKWWRIGLERALSVAAIYEQLGSRCGTGFLVRAGDLGLTPQEELLVLTNFHVVNREGTHRGLRPEAAEIAFEAADPERRYTVREVRFSSPPDRLDASILRLEQPVQGIAPLPFAARLPLLEKGARVYVIGHSGGRDLAYSYRDNELLDHEGPPAGREQMRGVCRVHYRAPTEGGSSGSPVFNDSLWQVIALHHMGGRTGMPRLNGAEGTYAANEGIAIQSIVAEART